MTDATAPARVGPAIHRFVDTGTAYDFTQSEEGPRQGLRDGDVLVITWEGVVGVFANDRPLALTEAHGHLPFAALDCNVRTMNGGRYSESVDIAERVAAELGLPLLAHLVTPADKPAGRGGKG